MFRYTLFVLADQHLSIISPKSCANAFDGNKGLPADLNYMHLKCYVQYLENTNLAHMREVIIFDFTSLIKCVSDLFIKVFSIEFQTQYRPQNALKAKAIQFAL